MKTKEILILGAGVSGLSTAITLQQRGYKVVIWAKDLPPNTTSNKAAACWYPYLCKPLDKVSKWAKYTLDYFQKEMVPKSESGCVPRKTIEVFDMKMGEPWWKEAFPGFTRPDREDLLDGYIDGYQIDGFVMDTSIYLDYLVSVFKSNGGQILNKTVNDIQEPLHASEIVINCTALGSRDLFHDDKIYPVRGQTVKVKPNGFETIIADDEAHNKLAYIIPRVHDIVLGGTAQENDWNMEVNPEDTKMILQKCSRLRPEFKHVEIIEEAVGLRPVRSEIRLEAEKFDSKFIVHNYGHGGAGFTVSWGCANDVADIVESI